MPSFSTYLPKEEEVVPQEQPSPQSFSQYTGQEVVEQYPVQPITEGYVSEAEYATPFGLAPSPRPGYYEDQQAQYAEPQLPPTSPPVVQTAVPEDEFSGLGTYFGGVRDSLGAFKDNPSLDTALDVGGAVLEGQNMPVEHIQNRVTQRAMDYAQSGDPNKTLKQEWDSPAAPFIIGAENNLTAQLPLPTAYGAAIGDALRGEGWKDPADHTPDYYEWYAENKEVIDPIVAERGLGAAWELYSTHLGNTLESGGIYGAAKGMAQGAVMDPGLAVSAIGTSGGAAISKGLRAGGHIGQARAVEGAIGAGSAAYDITDPILGATAKGVGKLLPPILRPSQAKQTEIAGEQVAEALADAGGRKIAGMVTGQGNALPGTPPPPSPQVAPNPTPANQGTIAPGQLPQGTPPAPQAQAANPNVPPQPPIAAPAAQGPPPPSITPPTQAAPQPPAFAPGSVIPPPPSVMGNTPPPARPDIRQSTGRYPVRLDTNNEVNWRRPIMANAGPDGRPSFSWDDGTPISAREMAEAENAMRYVHPSEFTTTDMNDSWWTRMRSAMTQSGYMYDDWPKAKQARAKELGRPEAAAAGNRFIKLTADRIKVFQAEEVQRIADNYAIKVNKYPDKSVNMGNRATSIIEALREANFDQPVVLRRPGEVIRYQPAVDRGRPVIEARVPIARDGGVTAPPPPTPDEELLDNMLLNPAGRDQRVREILRQMLDDPSAFDKNNDRATWARQEMYRRTIDGRPVSQGGEPFWVKPGTAAARKYPAAKTRYTSYYEAWKQRGGAMESQSPSLQSSSTTPEKVGVGELSPPVVKRVVREALDSLGLRDVKFVLSDDAPYAGRYIPEQKLVEVVLRMDDIGLDKMPMQRILNVVDHEAIHAMRDLGLFTEAEWGLLVREGSVAPSARGNGQVAETIDQFVRRLYTGKPGYTDEVMEEEIVANLFAQWRSGMRLTPEAESILGRVYQLLKTLVDKIKGTDAESLLKRIEGGEIGNRQRIVTGGVTRGGGIIKPHQSEVVNSLGTRIVPPHVRDEHFTAYHGSRNHDIDAISVDPPYHEFDNAGSSLGAFFTPDKKLAKTYAGREGAIYHVELDIENPFYIHMDEYYDRFVSLKIPMAIQFADAKQFKRELLDAGHDGIVVYHELYGDKRKPLEVVSFRDVTPAGKEVVPSHSDLYGDDDRFMLNSPVQSRASQPGDPVIDASRPIWQRIAGLRGARNAITNLPIDTRPIDPDEFDGLMIPEGYARTMRAADQHHRVNGKSIYQNLVDAIDEMDSVKGILSSGNTPDAKQQKLINRIQKQFGEEAREPWESMSHQEMARIAAIKTTEKWLDGIPSPDPIARAGIARDLRNLMRDVVNFRRAVGLTSWASAPRQTIVQYAGNSVTISIAHTRSLVEMGKIREIVNAYKGFNDPKIRPAFADELAGFGLPVNNQSIFGLDKSLATNQTLSQGVFGKVADIVAPKFLRNAVATPDNVARHGVAQTTFRDVIVNEQRALPMRAGDVAMAWRERKGLMIGPDEVANEMTAILKRHRRSYKPYAMIRGETIKDELINAFSSRYAAGLDQVEFEKMADRIGRDWNTVLNTAHQRAAKEANRVMFSWDNTRLDDVVQNVFLYHYWATRASALYAKEFAKKPWLLNQFVQFGEQLMQEAEDGDYPDWLKGWTRMLNTPAGFTLWFNPIDMIGTAFLFAEWQYGSIEAAGADLTQLGKWRAGGLFPFVWNPLLEYGLWLGGAFGEGASVPFNLTGLDRMTALGADVLNLLLFSGKLPGDMGRDAYGNPVPFSPRPLTEIAAKIGELFGQYSPPVNASLKINTQAIVYEILLKEAQEKGEVPTTDEIMTETARIMESGAAGVADPVLIEAQSRAVGASLVGPEFPGLPDSLQPIFGGVVRHLSPVRIAAQPTIRAIIQHPEMSNVLPGNPQNPFEGLPSDDIYDKMDIKSGLFRTPEAEALDQALEQYWDGTDPKLGDAYSQFYQIANGDQPTVKIGEKTYTREDLDSMSKGRMWDLAEEWLETQGYARSEIEAFGEARRALEESNPDVAGYLTYKEEIAAYPGGAPAFINDAMETSPAYRKFVNALPYPPGSEDWLKAASTWSEGYLALTGRQESVYDNPNVPAGSIPGIGPGTSAAFALKAKADKEIAAASEDASTFDVWKGEVENDVKNIYHAQNILDEMFGEGVIKPGDYIADEETYKAVIAAYKDAGIYVPKRNEAPAAYEYFEWFAQNSGTGDVSIETFLSQRNSGGGKELSNPTDDEIASQLGVTIPKGVQKAETGTGVPGRILQPVELRTGPSPGNPVTISQLLPLGMPVKIVYRDGGWSQIELVGAGIVGWVPDEYLGKR